VDVVILAAGAGRRFGERKQFVPVAPDGSTLLEVTLRDARHGGCDRAVVLTAPGCEEAVRELFARRPLAGLEVAVVVQRPEDLPPGAVPTGATAAIASREKPWGTAHAAWCVRHAVRGPFLLFNADDHYGPGAPAALRGALDAAATGNADCAAGGPPAFALLGYPLAGTLSDRGTVSRALCAVDGRGWLTGLREVVAIDGEGRIAGGAEAGRRLPPDQPVSMNAWAFTPAVFGLLGAHLRRFLATADLARDEAHLPAAIDAAVTSGAACVRVVAAPDRWCGMTWPEDRARVVARLAELERPREVAAQFGLDVAGPADAPPARFGGGHIHATWRVETATGAVLLQRLNGRVFPDPVAVAEAAATAARAVDRALRERGDADPRRRLVFHHGPQGRPWVRDGSGAVWRAMALIPGARPAHPGHAAEVRGAARLLGEFPGLVAAAGGSGLRATLPGLHDTGAHLAALREVAAADPHRRLAACRPEYERLLARVHLQDALADQPRRLVHNDAKLDNVLVDAASGEALCVVDLDTVMAGLAAHDFGDLVRSAVTGRPEDEPDLARIAIGEDVFADLAAGYLAGAAPWITDGERAALVTGALVIAWEQALRFLADFLAGDVYYAVADPGHNLRRARAQLRLLECLVAQQDSLRAIIGRGA